MGAKRFPDIDANHPGADPRNARVDDLGDREDINERGKRRGAHQRRHAALRSADMARISGYLTQGMNAEEIADEMDLAVNTVRQDIQHLNRLWVAQIRDHSEDFRGVILSKFQRLEALALESFHESKVKTITEHSDGGKFGATNSTREVLSAGDPAFLNCARECIKGQIQILGLDGKEASVKAFDKDAFLDAVAEQIAKAKMAATSIPTQAEEIDPMGSGLESAESQDEPETPESQDGFSPFI